MVSLRGLRKAGESVEIYDAGGLEAIQVILIDSSLLSSIELSRKP